MIVHNRLCSPLIAGNLLDETYLLHPALGVGKLNQAGVSVAPLLLKLKLANKAASS